MYIPEYVAEYKKLEPGTKQEEAQESLAGDMQVCQVLLSIKWQPFYLGGYATGNSYPKSSSSLCTSRP